MKNGFWKSLVVGFVLLFIGGTSGWVLALEREVSEVKFNIVEDYVTKNDFNTLKEYVTNRFDRLEDLFLRGRSYSADDVRNAGP
jgi:hypothetical protein